MRTFWRAAAVLGLALCAGNLGVGCSSRFVFDESTAGSGGSSGDGTGGSSGSGFGGSAASGAGAATASGGSAGQVGGTAGSAGTGGGASAGDAAGGSDDCGVPGCPAPLHCDDGTCVECDRDVDCKGSGFARCDRGRHRCVSCLVASDCPDGFACDALANRCLEKCQDDVNCPATAHGCDEARLVCYQCDEDRECAGSPLGSLCASDGSGCVQCRKSTDCPGQHCDQLTGKCVGCRDSSDCPSGFCSPSSHTCF